MKRRIKYPVAGLMCALFAASLVAGCGGEDTYLAVSDTNKPQEQEKIRVAYVTNGIDPFWMIAAAGVRDGAKEFGVECEVLMPPKGIVDQKRMIETLLSNNIQGIAISPIDAENQTGMINQAAALTNVITQDSDAPDSNRLCFVGMNNYLAGRSAGRLIKDALPEGGSVMIFVGRLEQLNSQQRRQGVIDELLDRPEQDPSSMQFDPPGGELKGEKYAVLGTRTDNFDYAKAKSNAEDTIASVPDIGCMVGLFAYNAPNCLAAIVEAGKVDKIKVVSFDEADETLQGIKDGHVQGTVSQQPYLYGYHSVRILAGLARGDQSVLPEGGVLDVESVVVTDANVDAFWAKLEDLRKE